MDLSVGSSNFTLHSKHARSPLDVIGSALRLQETVTPVFSWYASPHGALGPCKYTPASDNPPVLTKLKLIPSDLILCFVPSKL
jgi:hypothetical protein